MKAPSWLRAPEEEFFWLYDYHPYIVANICWDEDWIKEVRFSSRELNHSQHLVLGWDKTAPAEVQL